MAKSSLSGLDSIFGEPISSPVDSSPVEPIKTDYGQPDSSLDSIFGKPKTMYTEGDDDWAITKGAKAGLAGVKSMGGMFAALAGEAIDNDTLRDWGLDLYQDQGQYAGQINETTIASYEDVEGLEDAAEFLAYGVGNVVTQFAPTIAAGGVGGMAGRLAGKKLATKLLKKRLDKGDTLEEARDAVTKKVGQLESIGAGTGAYGSGTVLQTGEYGGGIYDETGDLKPGASAGFGVIGGALEAFAPLKILDKAGLGNKFLADFANTKSGDLLFSMAGEASTEMAQTVLGRFAVKWVDENAELFPEGFKEELINAGLLGSLGGAVASGVGALGRGALEDDGEALRREAEGLQMELRRSMEAKDARAADAAEQARLRGGDDLDASLAAAMTYVDGDEGIGYMNNPMQEPTQLGTGDMPLESNQPMTDLGPGYINPYDQGPSGYSGVEGLPEGEVPFDAPNFDDMVPPEAPEGTPPELFDFTPVNRMLGINAERRFTDEAATPTQQANIDEANPQRDPVPGEYDDLTPLPPARSEAEEAERAAIIEELVNLQSDVQAQLDELPAKPKATDAPNSEMELLEFIAASGGLDMDEAVSQGIDPEDTRKRVMGIKRVFNRKNAKTFDEMAELAREAGFDLNGANDVLAAVSDSLGGSPVRSTNASVEIEREAGLEQIDQISAKIEAARTARIEDSDDPPPQLAQRMGDPDVELAYDIYEAEAAGVSEAQINEILDGETDAAAARTRVQALTTARSSEQNPQGNRQASQGAENTRGDVEGKVEQDQIGLFGEPEPKEPAETKPAPTAQASLFGGDDTAPAPKRGPVTEKQDDIFGGETVVSGEPDPRQGATQTQREDVPADIDGGLFTRGQQVDIADEPLVDEPGAEESLYDSDIIEETAQEEGDEPPSAEDAPSKIQSPEIYDEDVDRFYDQIVADNYEKLEEIVNRDGSRMEIIESLGKGGWFPGGSWSTGRFYDAEWKPTEGGRKNPRMMPVEMRKSIRLGKRKAFSFMDFTNEIRDRVKAGRPEKSEMVEPQWEPMDGGYQTTDGRFTIRKAEEVIKKGGKPQKFWRLVDTSVPFNYDMKGEWWTSTLKKAKYRASIELSNEAAAQRERETAVAPEDMRETLLERARTNPAIQKLTYQRDNVIEAIQRAPEEELADYGKELDALIEREELRNDKGEVNRGIPFDGKPIIKPYPVDETGHTKRVVVSPMSEEVRPEEGAEKWEESTYIVDELFRDNQIVINYAKKKDRPDPKTLAEAEAQIDAWEKHALGQQNMTAMDGRPNYERTVVSLFDLSGNWARPYLQAGYEVLTVDIQDGVDMEDLSPEFMFDHLYNLGEIYAILAAPPCTILTQANNRNWAEGDANGRTTAAVDMVSAVLGFIEWAKPQIWAIENPQDSRMGASLTGKTDKAVTGLPRPRLNFTHKDFGQPFAKPTSLWGNFNPNLPRNQVESSGSFTDQAGGKSQQTMNARSETPEGFAYSFFMANNFIDNQKGDYALQQLKDTFPFATGAVEQAFKAGVPIETIYKVGRELHEWEDGNSAMVEELYLLAQGGSGRFGRESYEERISADRIKSMKKMADNAKKGSQAAADVMLDTGTKTLADAREFYQGLEDVMAVMATEGFTEADFIRENNVNPEKAQWAFSTVARKVYSGSYHGEIDTLPYELKAYAEKLGVNTAGDPVSVVYRLGKAMNDYFNSGAAENVVRQDAGMVAAINPKKALKEKIYVEVAEGPNGEVVEVTETGMDRVRDYEKRCRILDKMLNCVRS